MLFLGLKNTTGVSQVDKTVSGITFDPQDAMNFSLPDQFNGGHGGVYLYGKKDSGVHILQYDSTGAPEKDGEMTELFLFHE